MVRSWAIPFAAAALFGSMPSLVSAQAVGAAAPLVVDGTFEVVSWTTGQEAHKYREVCTLSGTNVTCAGHATVGPVVLHSRFVGKLNGARISGNTMIILASKSPSCSLTEETRRAEVVELAADGTASLSAPSGSTATVTSVSGECAATMPRASTSPPASWVGRWQQLTTVDPAVVLAPPAPPAADDKPTVQVDGNTITVTVEPGKKVVVTLVRATKAPPPTFSVPTVGEEAKAVERYVMTCMYEASYAHLPTDLRTSFVAAMPMPSDVMGAAAGAAAVATLDAGESAVNWVKSNPSDASLLGLSVAVSLAFPISAFANPAVATGSAALLRAVVGGAMVAGTTGFVSSLAGSFVSDKSAMQRTKEAVAKGGGDAVASIPGSLAGAGFEAVASQVLAKSAVTAGSVVVGVAVDKVMEKSQASQAIAESLMKAPSYASSLIKPMDQPFQPGGISINFDR
jgi:hypothetical protein